MIRFLTVLLPIVFVTAAWAQSPSGPVQVQHAWSRATTVATGAVYMTIANGGDADDRLVAAECPLAAKAELHQTINDNGVMKMRPVEAILVKAKNKAVLKPGGLHVMLMGLKQPLAEGQSFPLTLNFEKAGRIEVTVSVAKAGSMGDMPGMKM